MYVNSYERSGGAGSVNRRCPQKRLKPSFSARIGFSGPTGRPWPLPDLASDASHSARLGLALRESRCTGLRWGDRVALAVSAFRAEARPAEHGQQIGALSRRAGGMFPPPQDSESRSVDRRLCGTEVGIGPRGPYRGATTQTQFEHRLPLWPRSYREMRRQDTTKRVSLRNRRIAIRCCNERTSDGFGCCRSCASQAGRRRFESARPL